MRKRLDSQIADYELKEKYWLACFGETGNQNFLRRAARLAKKLSVLRSFRGVTPGLSMKQINEFQKRAHDLTAKVLRDRQQELFKLVYTI